MPTARVSWLPTAMEYGTPASSKRRNALERPGELRRDQPAPVGEVAHLGREPEIELLALARSTSWLRCEMRGSPAALVSRWVSGITAMVKEGSDTRCGARVAAVAGQTPTTAPRPIRVTTTTVPRGRRRMGPKMSLSGTKRKVLTRTFGIPLTRTLD